MYRPKSEYYDLPTKYDETVVRLLVQSPTRMYVYWEVAEDSIKNFYNNHINYNNCTPVLKITNLTMNYSYEIPVDPYATNYYIEVKDANCNYKVELGRRQNDRFISVFESNQVTIPRSAPIYNKEAEEIIYKNYLRLNQTERFTIYYKPRQNSLNTKQHYDGLAFSTEDTVSSAGRYMQK